MIGFCLILLIFAISYSFKSGLRKHHRARKTPLVPIKLNQSTNILVMGSDEAIPGELKAWNGRSDFIAVVNINPYNNQVSIISIPRDTYVELSPGEYQKINAANVWGGYKLSKRTVEKLLGLPIDHTLVFSIKAATEMIDQFGPFKILVTEQMSYHDHKAGLDIEINPGLHSMNGKELIKFLRYRKSKGDIGRISRQQVFFRAVIRKVRKDPSVTFKVPGALLQANKLFLTDMSFREMFELINILKKLKPEQFSSYIVPGDFGDNGLWISDRILLQDLIRRISSTQRLNDRKTTNTTQH